MVAWAGSQARLLGTVKDSAGKPIAGAVLTFTTDELKGFEKKVEVGADGSFSTLLLDATRRYTLRIEAPGYVPAEQPLKVAAGSTDNKFAFVLQSEQEARQREQGAALEQPGYKELNAAFALLNEGKKAEAEEQLDAAVKIVPGIAPAWAALAELAFDRGDSTSALERARKCLEIDAESSDCLAVAANAARAQGDTAAHQDYLTRFQRLNPDDPASLFNQAVEFINAANDEQAKPLLEKCLTVDPAFPKCLFEYGMLLLRSGDMAGAKAKLQRYLEVAPTGEDAAAAQETIKYL
jgi:tetratricopeptide (TPR) repeat protein